MSRAGLLLFQVFQIRAFAMLNQSVITRHRRHKLPR